MAHSLHLDMGIAAVAMLLAMPALGAIYRWVDDEGRVHFSDVVPEKYRSKAMLIDSPATGPSIEQQREAAERAAKENARAGEMARERESRQPPERAPASPASASAKRPPAAPNESTDCETWRRLYRESLDCFAPYRTARGGTKAEAFEHCTPVLEPPIRCGLDPQ